MRVHSLVVCLLVVLSAGLLYGQGGANGTILGTVTDNSGRGGRQRESRRHQRRYRRSHATPKPAPTETLPLRTSRPEPTALPSRRQASKKR